MLAPSAPCVAVIIAAYNSEASIGAAIRSALSQNETAEVCVIDDGSRDDTLAAARAAAGNDERFIALAMERNSGPAAARNRAIAATKAPWIAVLDADDFLLEGRFRRLLRWADNADFLADSLIRTPLAQGHDQNQCAALQANVGVGPAPAWLSFAAFVKGNLGRLSGPLDLGFIKPLMRRSFLEQHAIQYAPELRLGEDYELYARALAYGARFLTVAPQGYVSIDRPGSLSNRHSEDDLRRLRDCDDRLLTIREFDANERAALAAHRNSVDCRLQWRLLINAVKARDPVAALATFRTPAVALYLARRLGEQAWLRSMKQVAPPR